MDRPDKVEDKVGSIGKEVEWKIMNEECWDGRDVWRRLSRMTHMKKRKHPIEEEDNNRAYNQVAIILEENIRRKTLNV